MKYFSGGFVLRRYSSGILMRCCQSKQLHPIWDGRLVSMKMGKKERKKERKKKMKERKKERKKT